MMRVRSAELEARPTVSDARRDSAWPVVIAGVVAPKERPPLSILVVSILCRSKA